MIAKNRTAVSWRKPKKAASGPHERLRASPPKLGITVENASPVSLSRNGKLAFLGGYSDATNNFLTGIFTQNRVVVKNGDTVGGFQLNQFSQPAISERGVIGYEANSGISTRIYVVGGHIVAKSGDVIDGLTLLAPGQPFAPLDGLSLNACDEALFLSRATDASGNQVAGLFTGKHKVVAAGDVIDTIQVTGLSGGSINDRGEIVFVAAFGSGIEENALILATPKRR